MPQKKTTTPTKFGAVGRGRTVLFADGSAGEYDEDGFQLLYNGTIFVNSAALDEPMNFLAAALAEKTESGGIRIGDVELVPAKTIEINIANNATAATYVEGALEIHHGTDVYVSEGCEDPFLGLSSHHSLASFEDDGAML